ncbi:MAG: DUF5596 domain-containing protein [Clostridia bacterium]|nr:DUF5596 domain-containing protein [Clostridia bacterium]
MKNHLKEFGYDRDDADFLLESYDRVAADPEALDKFKAARAIYDENFKCDYDRLVALAREAGQKVGLRDYTSDLLVLLTLLPRAREYYRAFGIGEDVYFDSFSDLRFKNVECRLIKGFPGTFVFSWEILFFKLVLFSMGRLQFELVPFGSCYSKDGKTLRPRSNVLNTHIPRTGTKLVPAECDAAFSKALEFFRADLSGDPAAICSSWLLFPQNREFLKPGSNLINFMDRFDILSWHYSPNYDSIWRLFDTDEKNPDRLPADTSFRRAYIDYFKKGGRFGSAKGVFFF